MKPRLFNILSGLSLLLFLVLIWIWSFPPSSWGAVDLFVSTAMRITLGSGRLIVVLASCPSFGLGRYSLLGFLWENDGRYLFVHIPCWVILAPMLIVPAIWFIRKRQADWRLTHSLCLHCGYDLRASKDRCPECGTPIIVTESKA